MLYIFFINFKTIRRQAFLFQIELKITHRLMFQTILVRSRCHILSSEMLREHVNLPVSVPFLFTYSSQTKNADNGTRVIYAVRIRIHCLLIGHFLMFEYFSSGFVVASLFTFCSLAYKLTHGRCSARDNPERYCGWF